MTHLEKMKLSVRNGVSERARMLKDSNYDGGTIVYWMSRDQRVEDNPALVHAAAAAVENDVPLRVVFCLVPEYLGSTERQFSFMISGLKEVEMDLEALGIPFDFLQGYPQIELPYYLHENGAGSLVTDFDPIRVKREWKRRISGVVEIPMVEVDAHNVVPCWAVSSRRVMSFANFRSKIRPLLAQYLVEPPALEVPERSLRSLSKRTDWEKALHDLKVDHSIKAVDWIVPGEKAAKMAMTRFVQERLTDFPSRSQDPGSEGQSDLSPYLHFGQLSALRVALSVQHSDVPEQAKERYLDQLIVKREISDNFCLHTTYYDSIEAFPRWARRSIDEHRSDPREHIYSLEQLEKGQTHDPLWNATQLELVKRGKIHGYLREYWANKIMEWTKSPEDAFSMATYLNDRYSMDGRDPSGYTGIAMVIGGLYDRPWESKEVLGKVRRMTYTGARLRFDVKAYQDKVGRL